MTEPNTSPRPLRFKAKGPTKPGGIKEKSRRPKAAVRKPNGRPDDGTKYKSQAPSAPTSPHDETKCKSKAPSIHSHGPNQWGSI